MAVLAAAREIICPRLSFFPAGARNYHAISFEGKFDARFSIDVTALFDRGLERYDAAEPRAAAMENRSMKGGISTAFDAIGPVPGGDL
jgi:hypothetical protein